MKISRPPESTADTQPQLQPALLDRAKPLPPSAQERRALRGQNSIMARRRNILLLVTRAFL
jgi:hypothetical protein